MFYIRKDYKYLSPSFPLLLPALKSSSPSSCMTCLTPKNHMVLSPAWSQGVRTETLGTKLGSNPHMAGLFRPLLYWASMQTRAQHTVPPPWKTSFCHPHPLVQVCLCIVSIQTFPLLHYRETPLFGLVVPVLREAWKEVSTISHRNFAKKNSKTTAPRIPAWSPTVVLTRRHSG